MTKSKWDDAEEPTINNFYAIGMIWYDDNLLESHHTCIYTQYENNCLDTYKQFWVIIDIVYSHKTLHINITLVKNNFEYVFSFKRESTEKLIAITYTCTCTQFKKHYLICNNKENVFQLATLIEGCLS